MVCHRKLWLFAHGINMEHSSELVYTGKIIHENTYTQRTSRFKEIELGGIKIDYYDTKNKTIHEVKKSPKERNSHLWQLKYYIYKLEQAGIMGTTGILEYPKYHKTEEVFLSAPDKTRIQEIEQEIQLIINTESCPPVINKPKCKNCSYFDFCYATEEGQDSQD
jgi:CRISPR-associated exonuclease Cas4